MKPIRCLFGIHKRIIERTADPDFPLVRFNGAFPLEIETKKCKRCGKIFSRWTAAPNHPNCRCQIEPDETGKEG